MCSLIALLMLLFGLGSGIAGFTAFTTQSGTAEALPAPAAPIVIAEVTPETFSCASVSASQDVTEMLAVVDNTFETGVWSLNVDTSGAVKTTATWTANSLGAVAFLEWLHYDCGVSQAQIDQYYSPDNFHTLFANYDSYQQTAKCGVSGLELYQFDASFQKKSYLIDYWVDRASPTRVAGLMLVFPTSQSAQQAVYAGRLFPKLPTCESAAG